MLDDTRKARARGTLHTFTRDRLPRARRRGRSATVKPAVPVASGHSDWAEDPVLRRRRTEMGTVLEWYHEIVRNIFVASNG